MIVMPSMPSCAPRLPDLPRVFEVLGAPEFVRARCRLLAVQGCPDLAFFTEHIARKFGAVPTQRGLEVWLLKHSSERANASERASDVKFRGLVDM